MLAAHLLAASALVAGGHEITPPTFGPTPYRVGAPQTASNGNGFFTVWKQYPDDRETLFGAISDGSGNTLTRPAFELPPLPRTTWFAPAPAPNGWVLLRGTESGVVEMCFVSATGLVLGKRTVAGLSAGYVSEVVESGGRYLLPAYGLGHLIDANGVLVAGSMPLGANAAAAPTSDGFALAVLWARTLHLHRMGPDGILGDGIVISGNINPLDFSIAGAGSSVGVVWRTGDRTLFATFDRDNKILRPAVTLPPRPDSGNLRLVHTGGNYLLSYYGLLLRLNENGVVLESTPQTHVREPAFAASATHFLLAGFGRLVSPELTVAGIVTTALDAATLRPAVSDEISTTLTAQVQPAIVPVGDSYAIAWIDRTRHTTPLTVAMLRRGAPAVRQTVELGQLQAEHANHSIASNGADSLVVFGHRPFARRLDRDGLPLESEPFALPLHGNSMTAVAWTGAAYVCATANSTGSTIEIQTVAVDPSGMVGSPRLIHLTLPEPGIGHPLDIRLAWNGTHLIGIIRGARADEALLFRLDAPGRAVSDEVLQLGEYARRASLATSGTSSLVVRDDGTRVIATVIDANFREGVTSTLFEWHNADFASSVAWDGNAYVVAIQYGGFGQHWLGMRRVDRAGNPIDVLRMTGIGTPDRSSSPAVAGDVAVVAAFHGGAAPRLTAVTSADVVPAPRPAAPRNARVAGIDRQLEIVWDDVSDNERGFLIEARRDGVWSIVAFIAPGATRTLLREFPAEVPLRLRAWNEAGLSDAALIDSERGRRHAVER